MRKIEDLAIGEKFNSEASLLKEVGLYSTSKAIRDKNKEYIRNYITYEFTGVKVRRSEEIIITDISNDNILPIEDNRKNNGGHNKGKTKYGDIVIPTVIYLLKQSPNNEIITYSTRLLELIGAISHEYDKIIFENDYINNRRYSFKQDLKKSFIESPCKSAANSNYIEYDNEYIIYQYEDFGKWYNATEREVKIFNEYRKETLKELECDSFTDLNKKAFKNQYIKATYNRLLKDKIYNDPLLGWIDYKWYTRIKLIDYEANGEDMRKEINNKVLEYFNNKIHGMIKSNVDYRKGINTNNKWYDIEKEKQVGIGIENKLLH